jgi:hypothetical protein
MASSFATQLPCMLVFGRLLARGGIAPNMNHADKAQVTRDMYPIFLTRNNNYKHAIFKFYFALCLIRFY